MSEAANWILIVLGAVLILLEVLLGAIAGFDLLLLGSAVLLGGLLGLLVGSPAIGFAAAGVLALGYVLLGRKRIRNRWKRPGIPSNVDALIGRNALVLETITADRPGRVKLEGDEWRAQLENRSEGPIENGERVRIRRVDGVTVFVAPILTDESVEVPRS